MSYVQNQLDGDGVAAVYRLYEVFTERFGIDDNFSGSIMLSPPTSEVWLLRELFPLNGSDTEYTLKDLQRFLTICETAGIVTLLREEDNSVATQEDGSQKVTGKKVWTTVTIPGFASLADEYNTNKQKKKSKGLETTR